MAQSETLVEKIKFLTIWLLLLNLVLKISQKLQKNIMSWEKYIKTITWLLQTQGQAHSLPLRQFAHQPHRPTNYWELRAKINKIKNSKEMRGNN